MSDIKRVEDKLDKLDERLDGLDRTLVKQEENLKEHMRRSDLLEKKLIPVETHVMRITWAVRGILWAAGVIAAVISVLHQLGKV
jgi:hypothetical protein